MSAAAPRPSWLVPVVPAAWRGADDPSPEELPFVGLTMSTGFVRALLALWAIIETQGTDACEEIRLTAPLDAPHPLWRCPSLSNWRDRATSPSADELADGTWEWLSSALSEAVWYGHDGQFVPAAHRAAIERDIDDAIGSPITEVGVECRNELLTFRLNPSDEAQFGILEPWDVRTAELHVCPPARVGACWHDLARRDPYGALAWITDDAPRDLRPHLDPPDLKPMLQAADPRLRQHALDTLPRLGTDG